MKIKELILKDLFTLVNDGHNGETDITKCFCCDLLSIAMGKAPSGAAWVTVMGNINTLAIATLTEVSCLVFAEGITLDENALKKAKEHNITVMYTDLPVFDAALKIHELI